MNKTSNKNLKLLKGTALGFATILCVSAFPMAGAISASGETGTLDTNTAFFITGGYDNQIDTGSEFEIPEAYLQDNGAGDTDKEIIDGNTTSNLTTAESIEVFYNGSKVTVEDNKFTAKYSGTYTIVYSATYGTAERTVSKELKVTASISKDITLAVQDDNKNVIPTIYDPSYSKAKDGNNFKSVTFPAVKAYDKDENEISEVSFNTAKSGTGKEVVVSVKGADKSATEITFNNGKVTIDGSNFNPAHDNYLGEGSVSVTYNFYENGKYIAQTVESFEIKNGYYSEDYKIEADLSSRPSFVTGVEKKLPTVEANAIFSDKDIEDLEISNEINVKSTIKVLKENDKNEYVEDDQTQINDGMFTAKEDGNYKFEYSVTDFYGNTASLEKPYTTESVDTVKPEVFVYDAEKDENYEDGKLVSTDKLVDAKHKLHDKTLDKNITIYAIAGSDNSHKADDMTIHREIDNDDTVLTIPAEFNAYNLVLNSTSEAVANSKTLKVVHEIEDGKTKDDYTIAKGYALIESANFEIKGDFDVYYYAKEGKGDNIDKETFSKHKFVVTDNVNDTEAPEITFSTKLKSTYKKDDVITFNAPTATDDTDRSMIVNVSYQIGSETPVAMTEEDEKYELDLSKITGTDVKIICEVADDYGNTSTLEKSFKIADIADTTMPELDEITGGTTLDKDLKQNKTITLPTIVYEDEFAALMNVDVELFWIDENDNKVEIENINVPSPKILNGKYTLGGIDFFASNAGNYEAVVSVTDPANNIVSTSHYFAITKTTDTDKPNINPPSTLSSSINALEIKVGEELSFNAPMLSSKDETATEGLEADDQTFATTHYYYNYNNAHKVEKTGYDSFKFKEAGEYTFSYYAVYKIGLVDQEFESGETTVLVTADETTAPKYEINLGTETPWNESSVYKINDEIRLFMVGAEVDLDMEKSKIFFKESTSSSSPSTTEWTLQEFIENTGFIANGYIEEELSKDGKYTITYSIYAEDGTKLSPLNGKDSYTLKVGDAEAPEIKFNKALEDNHNLNDTVTIDISKFILLANKDTRDELLKEIDMKVQRKDENGDWVEVVEDKGEGFDFKADTAGEYKLTVKIEDEAGWTKSESFDFTVNAEETEAGISNNVVGIVLIVISSLILVGVVLYFVLTSLKAKGKLGKKKKK